MTTATAGPDVEALRAEQRRVRQGIEIAAHLVRTAHAGDLDVVHQTTAQLSHDQLRQLVATLACAMPAKTNIHSRLGWLARRDT